MSSLVVGIMKCGGDLSSYSPTALPVDATLRELVEDLHVVANPEWGIDAVDVEVIADGKVLFDIKLNGKSVGYFALRTFVKTYGSFEIPELITHGSEEIVPGVSEANDHQIYVIPLFGEIDDVAE